MKPTTLPVEAWTRLEGTHSAVEAHFAAEELEHVGIRVRLATLPAGPDDESLQVIEVDPEKRDVAISLLEEMMSGDASLPIASREGDRWSRAGLAAVLGLLFGFRLAVRMRHAHAVLLVPVAAAGLAVLVAVLWPESSGSSSG